MRHTNFVVRLLLAFLVHATATNCPAGEAKAPVSKPIAPRVATIQSANGTIKFAIESLAKQTGLEVDISAIDARKTFKMAFDKTEFWKIVDSIAELTNSQVIIGRPGPAVRLIPNPPRFKLLVFWNGWKPMVRLIPNTSVAKPIVSVDGPFRIAAKEILARRDLVSNDSAYDLYLVIAWESRLPVCRMDAVPAIEKGEDDAGRRITVKPVATKMPLNGVVARLKPMDPRFPAEDPGFRLEGITRESKQIALLKGSYRITAAEEMLRFSFDDLAKVPATMTKGGVGVSINRFAKVGTFWIADIELSYPPDGPVFESFEISWFVRNRIALVSPDGKKFTTEDYLINGASIRYRFKESETFKPDGLKGWKLEYETIGAMREVTVKFELKGIPLP
jgi:hypothetical protein